MVRSQHLLAQFGQTWWWPLLAETCIFFNLIHTTYQTYLFVLLTVIPYPSVLYTQRGWFVLKLCLINAESLKHHDSCPNWTMVDSTVPSRWSAIALRRIRRAICAEWILVFCDFHLILGKWPTWRTILFHVFVFIFNSVHVSSTSCSSSGETNYVNTNSGSCHSVSVAVSCAGRKFHFRPAHDTATDSY